MNFVQGKVTIVSNKGKATNIQIDGSDWYGCGFVTPDKLSFTKGDVISFGWTENKGYKNVDLKTVEVQKGAQSSGGSGGAPSSNGGGTDKRTAADWARKDAQDAARQSAISVQSCRNSAIEVAKLLKELDALPLGSKKQDIAGNLIGFIDDLTEAWYNSTKALAEGVKEEPVADEGGF